MPRAIALGWFLKISTPRLRYWLQPQPPPSAGCLSGVLIPNRNPRKTIAETAELMPEGRSAATMRPEPEGVARLRHEREQASFDTEALHVVLSGGAENLAVWNAVRRVMNGEPLFDKAMDPYRSRTERHVRALAKARRLRELRREHGWGSDDFWNARRMAGEARRRRRRPTPSRFAAAAPRSPASRPAPRSASYAALHSARHVLPDDATLTLTLTLPLPLPLTLPLTLTLTQVLPDDVHWSMFVPNTMSMCSEAQQARSLVITLTCAPRRSRHVP